MYIGGVCNVIDRPELKTSILLLLLSLYYPTSIEWGKYRIKVHTPYY